MLDFMDGYKTKSGVWMWVLPAVLMYFMPHLDVNAVLVFMQDVLAPGLVGLGVLGKWDKRND